MTNQAFSDKLNAFLKVRSNAAELIRDSESQYKTALHNQGGNALHLSMLTDPEKIATCSDRAVLLGKCVDDMASYVQGARREFMVAQSDLVNHLEKWPLPSV